MSENITKILVPIDFSPHADRAFGYATALARRLGAELTLVHVVEDPFATGAWGAETYIPNIGELLQNLIAAAERQLTTLKDGAAAQGVRVKTAVITGRPAQSIIEHADTEGCDLIVIGTHGRTGLAHVVMGSVAERVLRKAPCPVLTVRADAGAGESKQAAA
jgi:nucleotide-binding universal stress UspA family protein